MARRPPNGLQRLYDHVDDGAFEQLRRLHEQLDTAVLDAYGWPHELAHDPLERNRRLYDLNQEIVADRQRAYRPF